MQALAPGNRIILNFEAVEEWTGHYGKLLYMQSHQAHDKMMLTVRLMYMCAFACPLHEDLSTSW